MKIILNGKESETTETNLQAFLSSLPDLPEKFSIALNGVIVPKADRQGTPLHDGDEIDIYALIAGG